MYISVELLFITAGPSKVLPWRKEDSREFISRLLATGEEWKNGLHTTENEFFRGDNNPD